MRNNQDTAETLLMLLINATGASFEDEKMAALIIQETLNKQELKFYKNQIKEYKDEN